MKNMKHKKQPKGVYTKGEKRDEYRGVLTKIIIRYFDKNNLGFGNDSDKAIIAQYRIYKYFDEIIYENKDEYFDMNVAVKKLREVLPELKYLRSLCEPDGEPYGNDNDYVNLCYVSDRWYCHFRLTWLIDLANRNDRYEKITTTDNTIDLVTKTGEYKNIMTDNTRDWKRI